MLKSTFKRIPLPGVALDLFEAGSGQPLLFLHPAVGMDTNAPWFAQLADSFHVYAAYHPGFGTGELPRWISTADDLVFVYLDLLDHLDLNEVVLAGVDFGAWLAAEIAVRNTNRLDRVVLADPVGIKLSNRESRDIVDVFTTKEADLLRLSYHNPKRWAIDASKMTEADALALFRNREATALFGWTPYMYNPKLMHRLHRINVPTLVLWGESDGIISSDYARSFAELIAGARFETIPEAGHYPHLEQPQLFAERIASFASIPEGTYA